MKLSEVFDKAADIIERVGWCQGTVYDTYDGSVCQLGAVRIAVSGNPYHEFYPESVAAEKELEKIVGMNPVHWNDRVVRDRMTVISTLRDAADIMRWSGR